MQSREIHKEGKGIKIVLNLFSHIYFTGDFLKDVYTIAGDWFNQVEGFPEYRPTLTREEKDAVKWVKLLSGLGSHEFGKLPKSAEEIGLMPSIYELKGKEKDKNGKIKYRWEKKGAKSKYFILDNPPEKKDAYELTGDFFNRMDIIGKTTGELIEEALNKAPCYNSNGPKIEIDEKKWEELRNKRWKTEPPLHEIGQAKIFANKK